MTLRSGERVRFGGDLWVRTHALGEQKVVFGGWARAENLKSTWAESGVEAFVEASEYYERDASGTEHAFPVPEGQTIAAILLTRPLYRHKAGTVVVVTRPAKTPVEAEVHDRHPLFSGRQPCPTSS